MMRKLFMVALLGAVASVVQAKEAETGRSRIHNFAAAVVPALQTPDAEEDVALLRVSLVCGQHRSVYGLDFGVIGNIVDEEFIGCGIAMIFNWTGNSRSAFQFAGGVNRSLRDFEGLQMALLLNDVERRLVGLQIGLANVVDEVVGMQLGGFNKIRIGSGFQLGGVNVAEQFTGVQIGLLNLNLDSSVPLSPVFNCRF